MKHPTAAEDGAVPPMPDRPALAALLAAAMSLACAGGPLVTSASSALRVERLADGPIVSAATHESIGANIQGPSLIRVPDWIASPLGRYYLYFADHKGSHIRLAYADSLTGPWTVHEPGALQLEGSHFPTEAPEASRWAVWRLRFLAWLGGIRVPHDWTQELTTPHIASPDVHVDQRSRRIVMYFHGLEGFARQVTRGATSRDGVVFQARPEILGKTYWRSFVHGEHTVAMAMPGQFYRSTDPLSGFEKGPLLFESNMRHAALLKRADTLHVLWTRVGDAPERILHSRIDLSLPWEEWSTSEPAELLRPERDWEGADAPLEPSMRSVAYGHVNQLRDPAIFEEDGRTYLVYAIAGESGLALAELHWD